MYIRQANGSEMNDPILTWRVLTIGTYNAKYRYIADMGNSELGVLEHQDRFFPYTGVGMEGGYIKADMNIVAWNGPYNDAVKFASCDTLDEAKVRCERYAKLMVLQ